MKKKAVVLLSGGLDSAVTLFVAGNKGYACHCLTFDYGQRHRKEIASARKIAARAGAGFKLFKLRMPWKGSSLTDVSMNIPSGRDPGKIKKGPIPSTYVPARNTVFLSLGVSYAEAIGARAVFIGAHYEDSSGYPDCRKNYLLSFGRVIKSGTKRGLEGQLKLCFPLIDKSKKEIIRLGTRLGVPLDLTWSCYKGGRMPCGECDFCVLREKGFERA